jgi:hypothetical protein
MLYEPKPITPQIVNQFIDGNEIQCYLVVVDGEEYAKCEDFSKIAWGENEKKRSGLAYDRGLCNTEGDPNRSTRIGKLGEMAFAKAFGKPVDLEYRRFGDKQDFVLGEQTVDLKTRTTADPYGLIRFITERGKVIPVDKDIYVFGYMAKEDRKNQRAEVMLVGYATKSEVTKEENVKKGRVGNGHYNYEVPYRNLSSIVMLSK